MNIPDFQTLGGDREDSMSYFRVIPHAKHMMKVREVPDDQSIAVAEAVRAALMRYVSLNQQGTVELLDLRPTILQALRDLRQQG